MFVTQVSPFPLYVHSYPLGQPIGAYLIRVSGKIFGYTLSFVDKDRLKVRMSDGSWRHILLLKQHIAFPLSLPIDCPQHFLVDYTDGQYSVFGGAQSRSVHIIAHCILAPIVDSQAGCLTCVLVVG